jgi:hypothetical protein
MENDLLFDINEVKQRCAERRSAPGKWAVWREGADVIVRLIKQVEFKDGGMK